MSFGQSCIRGSVSFPFLTKGVPNGAEKNQQDFVRCGIVGSLPGVRKPVFLRNRVSFDMEKQLNLRKSGGLKESKRMTSLPSLDACTE
jgi:hypothetical protein